MTSSPTVSVRGEATIEADPELASLIITVTAQDADRQTAVDLLSTRAKAVADALARFEACIEQSQTTGFHVYAELDHKKAERVRRHVGTTTTSVVLNDFAILSDLMVALMAVDLVSINGPRWHLRRASPVYRQARLAAAQDALTRARDYANAFGADLVGLVEIADEGMSQDNTQARPMAASGWVAQSQAREEPSFDLEPGRQQVVGQVEARFLITQPDLTDDVPAGSLA